MLLPRANDKSMTKYREDYGEEAQSTATPSLCEKKEDHAT